jgi:hypothetical protein
MILQLIGITELIGIIAKHSELGALGSNKTNGPKTPNAPPHPWAEILGVRGYKGGVSLPVPGYRGGKLLSTTIYIGGREEGKTERTRGNPRRRR